MDFNPECGYVSDMVYDAIVIGYRHFDTAAIYTTEKQVAAGVRKAIAAGIVTRDQLFLSTKIFMTDMHAADLIAQAKQCNDNLGHEYIDLLLLHGPVPLKKDAPLRKCGVIPVNEDDTLAVDHQVDVHTESWDAMQQLVGMGIVRSIGVANYNVVQLKQTMEKAVIKPAVNQIESNVLLQQQDIVTFCQDQGIVVTAHTPLGGNMLPPETPVNEWTHNPLVHRNMMWDNTVLKSIAAKHRKSVPQIMLKFQVDRGVAVIPKSKHKERLAENANIFDFDLDDEDRQAIRQLDSGKHCVSHFFTTLNQMPA
jgi:diketogulonate reductase-like aldo/keto reductase